MATRRFTLILIGLAQMITVGFSSAQNIPAAATNPSEVDQVATPNELLAADPLVDGDVGQIPIVDEVPESTETENGTEENQELVPRAASDDGSRNPSKTRSPHPPLHNAAQRSIDEARDIDLIQENPEAETEALEIEGVDRPNEDCSTQNPELELTWTPNCDSPNLEQKPETLQSSTEEIQTRDDGVFIRIETSNSQ